MTKKTFLNLEDSNRSFQDKEREDALSLEEDKAVATIPVVNRSCTDVICLLIFVVYILGMVALSVLGYFNGNPDRLLYGTNYAGELCGGELHPGKKYLAYPRANEDVALSGFLTNPKNTIHFFGVCVSKCPQAGDLICSSDGEAGVDAALKANPDKTRDQIIDECLRYPVYSPLTCDSKKVHNGCFNTDIDTTNVFFRCLPDYLYEVEVLPESGCIKYKNISTTSGVKSTCVVYKEVTKVTREQPTAGNLLFDTFNTYYRWLQALMGDIYRAWRPILTSSLGVTCFVGLMHIILLRCCVGVMVWISVFGTVFVSIIFTLFCYIKAGIIGGSAIIAAYGQLVGKLQIFSAKVEKTAVDLLHLNNDTNATYGFDYTPKNLTSLPSSFTASIEYTKEFTYLAYVMTAFSIIILFIVLSLFERILRAIQIFEVASKAIQKNMALVFIPFISTGLCIVVVAAWALSTAYIATSAEFTIKQLGVDGVVLDAHDNVVQFGELVEIKYVNLMVVYMFFGILWILNFINGITVMTTAGTVLQWFWNAEVSKNTNQSARIPILRSFGRTIRYHLGSVALGSFILAFVQFIRYIAAYLQRKLNSIGKESRFVRILCCAAQCFLKCVQKCVESVTRNAFIWCAMYGTPFLTSTKNSFFAVLNNIALVALVTFLGDIIQRFGQIFVMLVAGLSCWAWLDHDPNYGFGGEYQLHSFVFPVLITMFLSWFIAAEILSIYDIAVDTILLSYVQDKRLKQFKADHEERSRAGLKKFMKKNKLKETKLISQASFNTLN